MSAPAVVEVDAPVEPDQPAVAHHAAPGSDTDPSGPVALCGVRLIGAPAPRGYPHVCAECIAIHNGVLFLWPAT